METLHPVYLAQFWKNKYVYGRIGNAGFAGKGWKMRKEASKRARVGRWACVALCVAAWALLAEPAAKAQPKDPVPVKLRFKYDLKEDLATIKDRLPVILLRPNVPQAAYLFVENDSPDAIKNLTVKLLKVENDGTATPLKTVTGIDLKAKELKQIDLSSPPEKPAVPPPPVPADKAGDKKDADPGLPLAGPPFEFVVVFEQSQFVPREEVLTVRIMEPQEYVEVGEKRYTPETSSLFIGVKVKDAIKVADKKYLINTPCVVNLALYPDLIPGLVPIKTKGTYKQAISVQSTKEAVLSAEDLKFKAKPPESSRVYLTVDGFERAFLFRNSFTAGVPPELAKQEPRLRVWAPRVGAPGPKFPVKIEVDNVVEDAQPRIKFTGTKRPTPVLVRVGWWDEKETFVPIRELAGDRNQQVTYSTTGAGGGLLLKNTVTDWDLELDATDLFGTKVLRVELVDPKAGANIVLVPEQAIDAEKIVLLTDAFVGSPYAALSYDNDAKPTYVKAKITLDGTPPDIDLAFNLEKQKTHVKGTPVLVMAKVSDPVPVTGIKEVVFFLGKPTPKGTIPENVVRVDGENDPKDPAIWLARLPVATDKGGLFEISVQAVNQAGLANNKTITLILVDPGAGGGAEKKLAKIIGKVAVGMQGQTGVAVTLADAKGELKASTKSKPGGEFVFENVPPGVYQVSAANPALMLSGKTLVTVPEGVTEVKGVDLQIKR